MIDVIERFTELSGTETHQLRVPLREGEDKLLHSLGGGRECEAVGRFVMLAAPEALSRALCSACCWDELELVLGAGTGQAVAAGRLLKQFSQLTGATSRSTHPAEVGLDELYRTCDAARASLSGLPSAFQERFSELTSQLDSMLPGLAAQHESEMRAQLERAFASAEEPLSAEVHGLCGPKMRLAHLMEERASSGALLDRLAQVSRRPGRNGVHLLSSTVLGLMSVGDPWDDPVLDASEELDQLPTAAELEAFDALYSPGGDGAFTTIESALAAARVL